MAPIYKSNILNSEDTSSYNIVQCRTCSILAELIIKKNINDEIFGIKTDFLTIPTFLFIKTLIKPDKRLLKQT